MAELGFACGKPQYPAVTASEINIVYAGRQFELIQADIVNAIVEIANRQACSDAFKEYGLTIPYDVVKSGKLKVAGSAVFYQPKAPELLGWSATQVSTAKQLLEQQDNVFRPRYTADFTQSGISTVVFNANQVRSSRFGGLRAVVTHAFIHLGGQRGDRGATPHDLAKFAGYNRIINACR